MLLQWQHLCSYSAVMSDLLTDFERDCAAADVAPSAALKEGGVHPSLWAKWKKDKDEGGVSPTLRNFEAARAGLAAIIGRSQDRAA